MNVYEKLRKAYAVACPIVSLSTSDPAAAINRIIEELPKCAVITWDCAAGLRCGKNALPALATITDNGEEEISLVSVLIRSAGLPPGSILVIKNAHRFLGETDVMQAVWNLRDVFKSPKRMLVLMGNRVRIPPELENDVVELDEPLPTHDEIASAVSLVLDGAGLESSRDSLDKCAHAGQGLSLFGAEQLAALNLTRDGVDVPGVWADKCRKISETPGLSVISGAASPVAGCYQIKEFLGRITTGREAPNAIVYVDEIDKGVGGSRGDTSGVSQDQLQNLLTYMQDKRASGCILLGPPGAAKSATAKEIGHLAGIPTIQLDLGGMKDSLVGSSEARIRDALKVIDSVSGGRTLWIATCNAIGNLPVELRRRFKYGTWFFDLPSYAERRDIWELYCKKYELEFPDSELLDQELSGAEIESICEISWKIKCDPEHARQYIVPVAISAKAQIAELRDNARGRYLSAAVPGVYAGPEGQEVVSRAREIDF